MQKRYIDIHMLLTDEEYELLKKRMEAAGVSSRSAFLRKMALNGYCVKLDLPALKEMTTLLRRCSDNLNQYAKKANASASIYAEDIQDLQIRLNEIWDCARKILAELAKIQ